jgi:hypothetical protein
MSQREWSPEDGATWTGSPKGVFAERKHHKPRLALNNITAGVRERSEWSGGSSDIEGKTTRGGASECGQRTSFNRTRVAGHLDEIQGVVASTVKLSRNGAVGFIDWLDGGAIFSRVRCTRMAAVTSRNGTRLVDLARVAP